MLCNAFGIFIPRRALSYNTMNTGHSTTSCLSVYCNIASKLSPNTSSTPLIHLTVSLSTISSSSSLNSAMKGSISGNKPSHSSPNRDVSARSHCTVARRVCASSARIYLSSTALMARWLSVEDEDAEAKAVIVEMMVEDIWSGEGMVS